MEFMRYILTRKKITPFKFLITAAFSVDEKTDMLKRHYEIGIWNKDMVENVFKKFQKENHSAASVLQ